MNPAWTSYEPYLPPFPGLLSELSRAQARESFDDLMASRPRRWDQLRRLTADDGVELGTSDQDLDALNAWFDRSVEPDPEKPARLANRWYAVVNDVAIVLGDVLVERCPGLRWELFTGGKKDVAHQKHVIAGFSKVPNPRYHVDIDRLVAGHATRVVTEGLPTRRNAFTTLLAAAQERA